MLYITHGNDRAKQKKYIDEIKAKHRGVSLVVFERSEFNKESFEQTISGGSLFGERFCIILDGVCEIQENREFILNLKKELKESATVVILQETSLEPDFIDQIMDYASEVVNFATTSEKPDFTLWSAFYAKDKKGAWQAYLDISKKEASEKTHAGLLSQVKNMYKIKNAPSGTTYKELGFAKEGGYGSAAWGASKYSAQEISDMLYKLSEMPLRAHNGELDFSLELEKFILKFL